MLIPGLSPGPRCTGIGADHALTRREPCEAEMGDDSFENGLVYYPMPVPMKLDCHPARDGLGGHGQGSHGTSLCVSGLLSHEAADLGARARGDPRGVGADSGG